MYTFCEYFLHISWSSFKEKIVRGVVRSLTCQQSWNRKWLSRVRRTYSCIVAHEFCYHADHFVGYIFKTFCFHTYILCIQVAFSGNIILFLLSLSKITTKNIILHLTFSLTNEKLFKLIFFIL